MKLPQYKSHKIVGAAQILALNWIDEKMVDLVLKGQDLPYRVTAAKIEKHKPDTGWYLVQYEDGYISFSPAESFENGNTKIPDYEWVENTGERPADLVKGDHLNVKFRDGEIIKCLVVDAHGLEEHNWKLSGNDHDIVSYCRPTGDELVAQSEMREECSNVQEQCREAIEHAQRMIDLLRSKWTAKGHQAYLPSVLGGGRQQHR